jgi:hypothetical protein
VASGTCGFEPRVATRIIGQIRSTSASRFDPRLPKENGVIGWRGMHRPGWTTASEITPEPKH